MCLVMAVMYFCYALRRKGEMSQIATDENEAAARRGGQFSGFARSLPPWQEGDEVGRIPQKMLTVSVCVSPLVVVVVWGFILFYRFYLTDGPCTYYVRYALTWQAEKRNRSWSERDRN